MNQIIRKHLQKDSIFAPLLDQIKIAEITQKTNIYCTLLESIVSQQLSVKASDSIWKRFLDLFENNYPNPKTVIELDLETLRKSGLSQQKANYIKNVALFSLENSLDYDHLQSLSDIEIVNYLTKIKGVGVWTVQMLLMFHLQRGDVFPIDDLGIRNAIVDLYALKEEGKALKTRLLEISDAWKPYRSFACFYLWRWRDSKNKK
ncbi:MAG: DNA-3-methyladenine glycosylase 2 family protein [Bacteroidetes bacterium]|nr:MAG: DNA-3-methyladenine glycosylase 2 family protein [Bacteroidota bacterium]